MLVIETIGTTYLELFTIRISNSGFERTISHKDPITNVVTSIVQSSISEVLSIEPDASTRKLFLDHDMNYKWGNDMLICYVRTESTKPYFNFPAMQIRFLVKAQSAFLRRTDVKPTGSQEVYQFTNVGRTGDAANRFLTMNAAGVEDPDKKLIGALGVEQNCFAVIDILTDVADADYRVFNAGNLVSPDYKILFKTNHP
jgi:hypothetical protein